MRVQIRLQFDFVSRVPECISTLKVDVLIFWLYFLSTPGTCRLWQKIYHEFAAAQKDDSLCQHVLKNC